MEKKDYRISDAIPEMSTSFNQRVEDTLKTVCAENGEKTVRTKERRPAHVSRKMWIVIAAAVLLLAATTAVAAAAIIRSNYSSPADYLMQGKEEREQTEQTVPDVENAIASAEPKTGDYSIVMLPEMQDAKERNEYRIQHGQPEYSEEDWGWIRSVRPEIEEVLLDGSTLVFNIRLHTDHGLCLDYQSEGQKVEAICEDVTYTVNDDATVHVLGFDCGGMNPGATTPDGATTHSEFDLEFLEEPFPSEGIIHMTTNIRFYDLRVDGMSDRAAVAVMRYSFSFNASAGADISEQFVNERALHGSAVLTMTGENGRQYNERLSLEGVVLTETVSYRNTGIYISYRIKSAPDGWTKEQINALLMPSFERESHYGLSVTCAPAGSTDGSEVIYPGSPNSIASGEYIVIMPFFPAEYESLKAQNYEIRLGYRYVSSFNGQPAGEDWRFPDTGGAEDYSWDWTSTEQLLDTFPLPLP